MFFDELDDMQNTEQNEVEKQFSVPPPPRIPPSPVSRLVFGYLSRPEGLPICVGAFILFCFGHDSFVGLTNM